MAERVRSRSPFHTGGSALVIVLALTALVMVLVLATLSMSREHSQREALVADGLEVDAMAQLPADLVLSQLKRATTQAVTPEGERLLWASQPGMVRTFGTVVPPGQDRPQAKMHYRLYSAPVMNTVAFDAATEAASLRQWQEQPAGYIDLNAPVPVMHAGQTELHYPIADPAMLGIVDGYALRSTAPGASTLQPLPLPAAWIYVLKDGRMVVPSSVDERGARFDAEVVSAMNPIVARIAFWTDDESCKLNLNTASEPDPWDMPMANTLTERGYAMRVPATFEHHRFSEHPAFTSLSVVMKHYGGAHRGNVQWPASEPVNPLDANASAWWQKYIGCYQTMVPHGVLTMSDASTKQERHFTSVDEFYFAPDRTRNGLSAGFAMKQDDLRESRFLLTTHSSAPELNPFGQPKIALWMMPKEGAQRTLADQRFNECSKLDAAHEFMFQRASNWLSEANPGSSQNMFDDWTQVPRNQALFAWLQRLTTLPVPGAGGRFIDKYGERSRDQILVSMLDMLRWSSNPSLPPRGALGEQSAVPLTIERSSADGSTTSLRGFGRHPTFSEVAVVFACTDVERTPDGQPRDDNHDGICDRATKLRAFMVVNPFVPSAGPPALSAAWSLRIRRLMQWSIGKGISPQLPGGNVRTRAQLSTSAPINQGASTAFSNFAALFLKSDGSAKEIGNRTDPANGFPFISQNDITLQAVDGRPGSTLAFSGGRIIVDVMPVDSALAQPKPNDAIHSVEVEFPKGDLPMPSLRVADYRDGPRKLTPRFTPVRDGTVWRLPLIERGDIVRSMVINPDGPSHGDARLIAARRELLYPEAAAWYRPHRDYATKALQAQSLRDGGLMLAGQFGSDGEDGHSQPTRDTAGVLLQGVQPAGNAIAATPLGLDGALQVRSGNDPGGRAGDWETGAGVHEDGALINRCGSQPQGSMARGSVAASNGSAAMPFASAVGFGAIPSGAFGDAHDATPRPWQTLLFCPNPAGRMTPAGERGRYDTTAHDHAGFASPQDHLWLELFSHPITEPWPMTCNFSTEGKVNMNFQVLPWMWLRRATAMHGALQGVRITAIPTRALMSEGHSAKGNDDGSPIGEEFRYAVNAEPTLAAFDQRFDANDVFRTPSEICEMFLVPKRIVGHRYDGEGFAPADPDSLAAKDMLAWWQGDAADQRDAFEATGDNARESPYAQLYPRLCTQSNVYRVHYRVQLLRKSRATLPATWDDANDHVIVERRGSDVIERRYAPPDVPVDPATNDAAPSLHTQQSFHVVARERFTP